MDILKINEILKNGDKNLFFCRLKNLINNMGFEYCAYGVKPIYSSDRNATKLINNYATMWNETYLFNNYFELDPIVKHTFTSTQYMIWERSSFKEALQFWDDAKQFNINAGFSYPHRDLYGRIGVLTFSGSDKTRNDIVELAPVLTWVSHISHIELANYIMPISEDIIPLSEKERDILLFTTEGKNTHQIANAMHLTDSTINYHFTNIFKKLSVKSKQEAVAKSLLFNLIYKG